MYLSEVRLKNWRSYRDACFQFAAPEPEKRLSFIGAMNGHGKTSLLTSLYLGLFGVHGLRFVEGLDDDDAAGSYRKALGHFRHHHSDPAEPTSIEIELLEAGEGLSERSVRIRRTWHYQANGQLRPGDGGEEVHLYVDHELVQLASAEQAIDHLQDQVFPSDLAPAFLFDGEQAQRMIFEGGSQQFQREVAVLFGTARVDAAATDARDYSNRLTQSMGGNRAISQRQRELKELKAERERLDAAARKLDEDIRQLQDERTRLGHQVQQHQEKLRRAGDQGVSIAELHKRVQEASEAVSSSKATLDKLANDMGLALAATRLRADVLRRLRMEARREAWLSAKQQTEARSDRVLGHAAPEPHEEDPLLASLSHDQWKRLRVRITEGVRLIYEPPPDDYAKEYRFGFAYGDAREQVAQHLIGVSKFGSGTLRAAAEALTRAEQDHADAQQVLDRQENLGPASEQLRAELVELGKRRDQVTADLGRLQHQLDAVTGERDEKSKRVRKLMSEIQDAEPHQRRAAAAERAAAALEELSAKLQPIALERLRDGVTRHFLKIADERFAGGQVVFEGSEPVVRKDGLPDQPIADMSGYERRAFGIAYSLALVEATGRSFPLVIDTPLGNADSKYRVRTLEALAQMDVEQVILLAHNLEAPASLVAEHDEHVQQTFLIEWDPDQRASKVHKNSYFYPVEVE
jgi:DNA sulfur modification protein DndD